MEKPLNNNDIFPKYRTDEKNKVYFEDYDMDLVKYLKNCRLVDFYVVISRILDNADDISLQYIDFHSIKIKNGLDEKIERIFILNDVKKLKNVADVENNVIGKFKVQKFINDVMKYAKKNNDMFLIDMYDRIGRLDSEIIKMEINYAALR